MNVLCLFSVLVIGVASAYPRGYPSHGYKPQRAVMFGGYYSNPIFGRSHDYNPQGAMTAFVSRDAVATNAFSGGLPQPGTGNLPLDESEPVEQYGVPELQQEPIQPEVISPQEVPQEPQVHNEPVPELAVEEEQVPSVAEEHVPSNDEISSTEAVFVKAPTKRVPKRRKPVKQDDEEEESDSAQVGWPFAGAKGVPSYNAFFPITISGGGASRARQGNEEDYYPGSATAIANSFSTGKGGIATSHATSFGDPYLASMFRKGLVNFRSDQKHDA